MLSRKRDVFFAVEISCFCIKFSAIHSHFLVLFQLFELERLGSLSKRLHFGNATLEILALRKRALRICTCFVLVQDNMYVDFSHKIQNRCQT